MSDDRVAVVTGVGTGSLGEAIAASLRELGFRVLTSTRTSPTTTDTHAMELTSRDSVAAFARWVQESSVRRVNRSTTRFMGADFTGGQ